MSVCPPHDWGVGWVYGDDVRIRQCVDCGDAEVEYLDPDPPDPDPDPDPHTHSWYFDGENYQASHPHYRIERCSCGLTRASSTEYPWSWEHSSWMYQASHPHKEYDECSLCTKTNLLTTETDWNWGSYGSWGTYTSAEHERSRTCDTCTEKDYDYEGHTWGSYGSWQLYSSTMHKRTRDCTKCNEDEDDYDTHNWGVWKDDPTSSNPHDERRYCNDCAGVNDQTTPHNTSGSVGYDAHHTAGLGHKKYYTCSICGDINGYTGAYYTNWGAWTEYSYDSELYHRRFRVCGANNCDDMFEYDYETHNVGSKLHDATPPYEEYYHCNTCATNIYLGTFWTPPSAGNPFDITHTTEYPDLISISWAEGSLTDYFQIWYSGLVGDYLKDSNAGSGTGAGNMHSWNGTNDDFDTMWQGGVKAMNSTYGNADVVWFTINKPSPPPAPTQPPAPSVSSITTSSMYISWNSAQYADSYILHVYGANGYTHDYTNITGTSKTVTGLERSMQYKYAVTATNQYSGNSPKGIYSSYNYTKTVIPSISDAGHTSTTISIKTAGLTKEALIKVDIYNSSNTLIGSKDVYSNGTATWTGLIYGSAYHFKAQMKFVNGTYTDWSAYTSYLYVTTTNKPADWNWSSSFINQSSFTTTNGKSQVITASEWNNFLDKVKEVVIFRGSSTSLSHVTSGQAMVSSVNSAVNAIESVGGNISFSSGSTHVTKSFFNTLKSEINRIIDL